MPVDKQSLVIPEGRCEWERCGNKATHTMLHRQPSGEVEYSRSCCYHVGVARSCAPFSDVKEMPDLIRTHVYSICFEQQRDGYRSGDKKR